jgi:hypothetical protein
VLSRLASHEDVLGVALLGSTAREVAPWSDYDLLVVTVGGGPEFDVEFTYIDHRPADVVFVDRSLVRRLLEQDVGSQRDGDLLRWLAESRIALARTAELPALRERAMNEPSASELPEAELFFRWVEANFNLIKARRWLSGPGDSLRIALELHLLRALSAVPADHLACRGQPWRGEKQAAEWLLDEDPAFLEALAEAATAGPPAQRVARYAALVEQAFQPVGRLWARDETAGGWLQPRGDACERSRWERLMQRRHP